MSILSCSAPDCDNPAYNKKRALCQPHYNRFMSGRDLRIEPAPTECVRCGDRVTRKAQRPGPPPKYCTDRCRQQASHERKIDSGAYALEQARRRAEYQPKPVRQRACAFCGGTFDAKREDALLCSSACGNRWRDSKSTSRCAEAECARGVRAKGLCSMHWRRKARAEGREVNPEWDERRKANYQQRRALKLQLPAENIRPADVYERDEWVCGICSTPVDRTLAYPDPMSPSLDHVLPLSLGGHHTMENVALAHLSCNVRKGNRVEADAMSV